MKIARPSHSTSPRLLALALLLVLPLACGSDPSSGQSLPTEPEDLVGEQTEVFNELATLLEGIHSKGELDAAAPTLRMLGTRSGELGDAWETWGEQMQDAGPMGALAAANAMSAGAMEFAQSQARFGAAWTRLSLDPELGPRAREVLADFGKAMSDARDR